MFNCPADRRPHYLQKIMVARPTVVIPDLLDEIAIFNIVLTKNDIQAIMDKGFYPAFPSGKLATVWAKIKSR